MCDCPCCRTTCTSSYDSPRWGLPGWCGCSCGRCIAEYAKAAYNAGKTAGHSGPHECACGAERGLA